MFEYKGWITLSLNSYEEDFSKLKQQVILLDKYISKFNSTAQFAKIINCNENYILSIMGVLNHENGILLDIETLLKFIGEVLPSSYGIIFHRDQEGEDDNYYITIKMTKGKIEEFKDNILSPCSPVIED